MIIPLTLFDHSCIYDACQIYICCHFQVQVRRLLCMVADAKKSRTHCTHGIGAHSRQQGIQQTEAKILACNVRVAGTFNATRNQCSYRNSIQLCQTEACKMCRCKVRVAGSLNFTYTDAGLLKYYAFFKGKRRAPSVLVDMSLSEFLERSQPGCKLPSLVYPQGCERYYLQSALTADLRKDIDMRQRPFSIAADAGVYQGHNAAGLYTQRIHRLCAAICVGCSLSNRPAVLGHSMAHGHMPLPCISLPMLRCK